MKLKLLNHKFSYLTLNTTLFLGVFWGTLSFAQTVPSTLVAELFGNPINYQGWVSTGSTTRNNGEVVLTSAQQNQAGAIYYDQPYSIANCRSFRVRFKYLMTGGQTFSENGITSTGDGLAFWFLENPPQGLNPGSALGMPNTGDSATNRGLKVGLDVYDNDSAGDNPSVMAYWGGNFQEQNVTTKVSVPDLRSNQYQNAEIIWNNGFLTVLINGNTVMNQIALTENDGAGAITQGYFGFSASTGLATDVQSIQDVQIFLDVIPVNNATMQGCFTDGENTGVVDMTQSNVRNQIASSGTFRYFTSLNDATRNRGRIPNPESYTAQDNEVVYVRVENNEGCYSIANLTIDLIPVQAIIAEPPMPICASSPIVLDGSASTGANLVYTWTTVAGTILSGENTSSATIQGRGNYYLTVTSGICQSTVELKIGNNQVTPYLEIARPEQISCINPQITIDATASEQGPNITYLWTTVDGNIVSGANTLTPVVSRAGTYRLSANNPVQNCSNLASVRVIESSDMPTSTFVLPELKTCRDFQVVLDGSASSSGANFTYLWTTTDGNIISGADTNTATVSAEGTYVLRVTNTTNGCFDEFSEVLVSDRTKPIAQIAQPELLSCSVPSLLLDGLGSSRGANLVYTWSASNGGEISGDNTGLTLEVTKPGTYTLNVMNSVTGCFDEDIVEVQADPSAIVIDLPAEITLACIGNTVLDASGSSNDAGLVFSWTTEDGIITGATNQLTASVSTVGIYRLTITNPVLNCERFQEITVIPDVSIPVVQPFYRLEECSLENRTGFATFDLRSKDAEIVNGNTNWSVSYYLNDANAQARINRLPDSYTNVVSPIQTIYVRVENNDTRCYAITNLDLLVNPLPSPRITDPFEVCDDDADGFEVFDLASYSTSIIDNDPEVQVAYYETLENAQDNLFPLSLSYANVAKDSQTIYVRAINNRTSCAKIVPLELVALAAPQINYDVENIEICDEDADGYTYFDLTQKQNEVLKISNQANVIVQYFTTEANAVSGLNAITDETAFRNTILGSQPIWARATNTVTDCFRYTQFDVVAHVPPQLQIVQPIEVCDGGNNLKDEVAVFDLSDAQSAIVNDELGYQVLFYTTRAAAEAGGNDFVNIEAFTNTVNPQILFTRVTHQVTNCVNYGNVTLRVLPNPSPETPAPLERCDLNLTGNGIEVFDLTERADSIENQEGGVVLSYFASEIEAEQNTNPIPNPETFLNTERDFQRVYVRATHNITNCYSVVPMDLIVNPMPESDDFVNLRVCAKPNSANGIFDLEAHANNILANISNPQEYRVTYYLNQVDAQNNVRQLPDLYTSTGLVQTIWSRVEHTDTECFITGSFDLLVGEEVVLQQPTTSLIECGDLVSGIRTATFDLTEFQESILNGINPADVTIKYFETERLGVLSNEILTPTNYVNTAYPQNIYVEVTRNQLPNCTAFTSFALQVNLDPIPILAQDLPICMDSQTNQTLNAITLNAGLLTATHDFIWERNGQVISGETRNTLQVQEPGDYKVTAINKGTLCEGVATTSVIPYFEPQATVNYLSGPFTGVGSVEVVSEHPEWYTYSLDGAQAQISPLLENLEAGMHEILVTDINGCGTQTLTIVITDYMRYFTPNGDGHNEQWKVIGLEENKEAKVWIFDRHGKLLKEMRSDEYWDGTLNGYALPSNDYWFKVDYVTNGNQVEFKSHFTLKR